jgi:hypothetical protein
MNNLLVVLFASLLVVACGGGGGSGESLGVSNSADSVGINTGPILPGGDDWLIPTTYIRDGGPGKDGIPSLDYPQFVSRAEADPLIDDNEMVVGIVRGDDIRAYPHKILNWHEVVNDKINGQYYAFSYCPLTGTSLIWDVPDTPGDKPLAFPAY